jgi:biotin carboxyl carrier protein
MLGGDSASPMHEPSPRLECGKLNRPCVLRDPPSGPLLRSRQRMVAPAAMVLVLLVASGACGLPRPAQQSGAWMSRSVAPPGTAPVPAGSAAPPPIERAVANPAWSPFASVDRVVLLHPAAQVERVAFHQSNLDGARDLTPLASATAPVTLDSRERDTSPRTAADVVVEPSTEIRSPVTGTVKRAGTYVLYCEYSDDFVVVEPDEHPGWEVKMLHIDGVRVRAGARVIAGQTVLAPRATRLPFKSQVEEVIAQPPWPHVHVEVIDPTIPDRPSPGQGCK